MIQRIQSLYLLAACILCVVALTTPLAYFFTPQGEAMGLMRSLYIQAPDGSRTFTYWALYALMQLVAVFSALAILLFRRRALQMRVATWCIILLVGWYAMYAAFVYFHISAQQLHFRPNWTVSLPFAAIVCHYLAFRGILRDERLIQSLNRLR